MIRIISHRSNLEGPSSSENQIGSIERAIQMGLDVEVDVWVIDGNIFLGHDEPQYATTKEFLIDRKDSLWIHCKNVDALNFLSKFEKLNIFWHQEDDFVLTRSNHIWTYPGKRITESSVDVMPSDLNESVRRSPFGICTDYPLEALSIIERIENKKI